MAMVVGGGNSGGGGGGSGGDKGWHMYVCIYTHEAEPYSGAEGVVSR
jgi:hypothetical protein